MSAGAATRRRRACTVAALAALLLVLTGCAQLTDISQRSLIFGLGLDDGPEPGMVTLSAQAMHPNLGGAGGGSTTGGGGGGGSGGGSTGFRTLAVHGQTFSKALSQLQAETDRQIFLGQVAVVFLGAPLARAGVLHDMATLLRSPQIPENMQVAVVEGRAVSFLRSGTTRQGSWQVLRFLQQPRTGQAVLANSFWHFMSQSLDLATATYAPAFVPNPAGEGFRFVGTAVLVGGRLVDTLSPSETDALSWVIHHGPFGGASVGSRGEEIHIAVLGVRATWDLSEPTLPVLRVIATGQVTASPGTSLADRPSQMTQLLQQAMTVQLEGLLHRLRADGADLFGIGEVLRERGALPPGPWPAGFKTLHFAVSVRLHLITGKIR
jgi:hypothetical protein